MTLSGFLLARIAEDEAVARAATPGRWHADDIYATVTADPFESARAAYDRMGDEDCWVIPESMDSGVGSHNLAHIARHDPARVLAECEAKRQIVALHWSFRDEGWDGPSRETCDCGQEAPCPTLCALALPYADHRDHRDEWKP